MENWNKSLTKRICTMMLTAVFVVMSGLPALSVKAAEEVSNARFFEESYFSNSMDDEMTYRIYLPEGYSDINQRYPVVYLLHQEDNSSQQFADVNLNQNDSWFVNSPDAPWEDIIVNDLIPHIDDTYRTISLAKYRGISGVSMGGFGAFVTQAYSQWMGHWRSAGKMVVFQLTAVFKDGSERMLNISFTKPVQVSMKVDSNVDHELAGAYHMNTDNKLEFIWWLLSF